MDGKSNPIHDPAFRSWLGSKGFGTGEQLTQDQILVLLLARETEAKIDAQKVVYTKKTAAQILSEDDRPEFEHPMPKWGIIAKCRELDSHAMLITNKTSRHEDGERDTDLFVARIIMQGCLDPKWTEEEALQAVKTKSNGAIDSLYTAILQGKKNEHSRN